MSDFLIKWFMSLLVGGAWATVSSIVAEKVGGRLGGLIAGLPSTAVVSLMFVGLTQGMGAMQEASVIVPLSSGLYTFFFISYLLWSKKGFVSGLVKSLGVWFAFAIFASRLNVSSLYISMSVWIVLIVLSISWVVKNIKINKRKIPQNISSGPIWIKAGLSGVVISTIVLISKLAGPVWGGIFATFPAITISTFLITIRSGGVEFTRLIAKNVMISTTTTVSIFAILVYFLAPVFGVLLGSLFSYLLLLMISIPLYNLVFSKLED